MPEGKLGILIPGIGGAVSTTFVAGVERVRRGLSVPVGSLTQLGTLENKGNEMPIGEALDLASLDSLVFGGWDIAPEDLYAAAIKAGVLEERDLEDVRDFLSSITPMKAVFSKEWVKNLDGDHVKQEKGHRALVDALRRDIEGFRSKTGVGRCVVVWCASTERFIKPSQVHSSKAAFEKGLDNNSPEISPSMLYAYAALTSGVPFINGAPNLTTDTPALDEIAEEQGLPICGKDFKTGQTLMKTIIAPGLRARLLGLQGWYSTNILGNRDGLVLDDPGSFKTKEESKLSVLDSILDPDRHPELYGDFYHKVVINYYPPRGDNKEGWDCIDIFGWLGYPMQIKVNFLCRDSILAAPVVLDLVLLSDLAQRRGLKGIQKWLSFYFKSPIHLEGEMPEHNLFIQLRMLEEKMQELL